jgi:hypothetical protein
LDCAALLSTGPDLDAVYQEIEAQYRKAGELEQKVWITYVEEGIGRLEEDYGMVVSIADRISQMADGYRDLLLKRPE